jgi:hypothetical protein
MDGVDPIFTFSNIGELCDVPALLNLLLNLLLNGKLPFIHVVLFVTSKGFAKEFDFVNKFIRARFDGHTGGVVTLRVQSSLPLGPRHTTRKLNLRHGESMA